MDGILFGNMLAASFERNLTPNLLAYRTMIGTEDTVMRVREGIIRESQERKKVAIISWNNKGAFEDLPHAVVLKSISSSGASIQTRNVIKSFLQSQASYAQVC